MANTINLVCGGGKPEGQYIWKKYEVNPIINFTVNGVSYSAEEGMTWGEWVDSEYNTIGAIKDTVTVWWFDMERVTADGVLRVSITDTISCDISYLTLCCFVAGTKITMADNSLKNIENVVVGDEVLSYNTLTNEITITSVKRTIIKSTNISYSMLTFDDGSTLEMATYHPLYTMNGWKSLINYNGYETLIVGDMLKTVNGYKELININTYEQEPVDTYTLDVYQNGYDSDEFSNFFANNTLAHNAPPSC